MGHNHCYPTYNPTYDQPRTSKQGLRRKFIVLAFWGIGAFLSGSDEGAELLMLGRGDFKLR